MNFQNLLSWDPTILDGVVVPEGIDIDILKGEIRLQCGLLTPLYPEPETMKAAIAQWFAARSWTFQHLVNIIKAEYSPIENTDRYDSTTRTITGSESGTDSENITGGHTISRDDNRSASELQTDTGTGRNENTVSAYNASTYQPAVMDENSATNSMTRSESESANSSESLSENRTRACNDARSHNSTDTFIQHLHGNIGVTTNQEMINQELDLLHNFNIYQWITFNLRDSLFLEVY